MLSRRRFLGETTAGLACLSLSGAVPGLFARAADDAARAARNDRALVVIELTGGNDGLNTVIPFEDDHYHRLRPTLRLAKEQVIRLTDQVGLHPAMAPAGELFKEGKLAIVQGVGYPQPDRSHFRSMEIWHTASTAARAPTTGWLGRMLDRHHAADAGKQLRSVALTASLPQALQANRAVVPLLDKLDGLGVPMGGESARQTLERRLSTTPATKAGPLGFLRRQAGTAYQTADQLRQAAVHYQGGVKYPEGALGQQLLRAAQLLTANLGVRLLYLAQPAYDTHSQQAATHHGLLAELAASLATFQQDLEKHGVADKVLVLVFSEFGRRVQENASAGTDHGAASCLFLAGSRVKGGLAGTYPSLEHLDDGDLAHTVDFRSVYATLLEQWLGCPAEPLLGAKYPLLEVLAG